MRTFVIRRIPPRAIDVRERILNIGIRLTEEVRLEPGRSDGLVVHQLLNLVSLRAAGGEHRRVRVPELVPHAAGTAQAARLVRRLKEEHCRLALLPWLAGVRVDEDEAACLSARAEGVRRGR